MFKPSASDKLMVIRMPADDVSMITDLLRDRMSVVGIMTPVVYQAIAGSNDVSQAAVPQTASKKFSRTSGAAIDSIKALFTTDKVYFRSNLLKASPLCTSSVDRAIRILIDQKFIRRVAGGHFVRTKALVGWSPSAGSAPTVLDSAARKQKYALVDDLRAAVPKLQGLELENAHSLLGQWGRKHFFTKSQWQLVHILLSYARTGKGSGSVAAA